MLVTLCNVMRQLHDNQEKLDELGQWYQSEQQSLADLRVSFEDGCRFVLEAIAMALDTDTCLHANECPGRPNRRRWSRF